jgi:hypothetical protein
LGNQPGQSYGAVHHFIRITEKAGRHMILIRLKLTLIHIFSCNV